MAPKHKGLGKGLDVLLPQDNTLLQTVVQEISIDDIDINVQQPRKNFNKEALEQLAQSIAEIGVLSPILVIEDGLRYQIVAGERRFRAARLAGLHHIPCIVREMTHALQLESALIENIQREDLNPVEEAQAIKTLLKECNYTQEEVAKRLGKSRPTITNSLRLLTLPTEIMNMVAEGALSAGHARVLAGIDSEETQYSLANLCIENGFSVRTLEQLAKTSQEPEVEPPAKKQTKTIPLELTTLQNAFREALGVKTKVTGNEKRGKIVLSYASEIELEHLYDAIGKLL